MWDAWFLGVMCEKSLFAYDHHIDVAEGPWKLHTFMSWWKGLWTLVVMKHISHTCSAVVHLLKRLQTKYLYTFNEQQLLKRSCYKTIKTTTQTCTLEPWKKSQYSSVECWDWMEPPAVEREHILFYQVVQWGTGRVYSGQACNERLSSSFKHRGQKRQGKKCWYVTKSPKCSLVRHVACSKTEVSQKW